MEVEGEWRKKWMTECRREWRGSAEGKWGKLNGGGSLLERRGELVGFVHSRFF